MLLIRLRLGLTIAVAVLFAAMAWEATEFQTLARYFPQAITVAGGVFAVLSALFDVARILSPHRRASDDSGGSDALAMDVEETGDNASFQRNVLRALYYLAWFIGYGVLISLVGILIASAIFLVLFLKIEAHAKWRLVLICTASMVVLLYLTASVLSLHWPTPLFVG